MSQQVSSAPARDLTVVVPSSALSSPKAPDRTGLLAARRVSANRRLLWRDGGSALRERLIVGWFGGCAPSGGFGLAFGGCVVSDSLAWGHRQSEKGFFRKVKGRDLEFKSQ